MKEVFIAGYNRTPIGRFAGSLAHVRPDDLAAAAIRALGVADVDEVVLGCTNQAGEDNRNIARTAALLAGLSDRIPAITVNRLCASGMDAVAYAMRAIRLGEAEMLIAGGVESMSRAPLVMPKPDKAFSRRAEIYDTTIGWRFVNPALRELVGADEMPQTGENVAEEFGISRADQDLFALRSQQRAAAAISEGRLAEEIIAVDGVLVDEHPRPDTTIEKLSRLRPPFRENGTVTAGNCSGINDGAAALVIASGEACVEHGLEPIARVLGFAAAGVAPRIMGMGPVPATQKLLERHGITVADLDVIEVNEAFASQVLASLRELGIADDDTRVNPNGGAIALGHPLGMTGARLVGTAALELRRRSGRYALATQCVGVGQGAAMLLERV